MNKVVPIDKSSTVLTILLAAIFLQEGVSLTKGIGVVLIAVGTFLMIEKKQSGGETKSAAWLWYALGSAVFASLTAILGKVGISGVESNLGTAIRTGVVLLMSWVMVFVTGKQGALKAIPKTSCFSFASRVFATGGSWLCYYKALQDGPCQRGGTYRQAEHSGNGAVLLPCLPRKADEEVRAGSCRHRGRHLADAVLSSV